MSDEEIRDQSNRSFLAKEKSHHHIFGFSLPPSWRKKKEKDTALFELLQYFGSWKNKSTGTEILQVVTSVYFVLFLYFSFLYPRSLAPSLSVSLRFMYKERKWNSSVLAVGLSSGEYTYMYVYVSYPYSFMYGDRQGRQGSLRKIIDKSHWLSTHF